MNAMLWPLADLEARASNPDARVRKWAVLRLAERPVAEAEPVLIRLFTHSDDPEVRRAAAGRLADHGTSASLPALMEVFRHEPGELAGECAAGIGRLGGPGEVEALLGRWQDGLVEGERSGILLGLAENGSPEALAFLSQVGSAADDKDGSMAWSLLTRVGGEREVRWAVGWYRNKAMEQGPERLRILGDGLGVWTGAGVFRRLLTEGGSAAVMARWSANYAEYAGALNLPPLALPDLRHGPDLIRVLDHLGGIARRGMAGIPAENPFWTNAGRFAALLDALSAPEPWNRRGRLRDEALDVARMEAGLALAALEQLLHLAMAARRFEAAAESASRRDELVALWAVDLPAMPASVVERMAAIGPAILPELIEAVRDWPNTWVAARSAALLERLVRDYPGACDAATDALAAGLSADLEATVDACIGALAAIGTAALPALARVLVEGDEPARAEALLCLAALPVPESVSLVHQHWETLMALGPQAVAGICARLASPELIERLRQEWRPGEPDLAEILYVLCRLHGITIPEWPQLEADLRVEEEHEADDPVRLPLACTSCGRTYQYEVGTIFVEVAGAHSGDRPDEDDIAFQNEVRCKRCGVVDQYRLTGPAMTRITAEMVSMMMLRDFSLESKSVVLHPPLELMDGRRMGFRQGIADYQDRISLRPGDPDLQVRLGNIYRNLRRYPAAREQYNAALALEPGLPEAHYNLALMADEHGQTEVARHHFRKCRELIAALPAPGAKLLAMARSAAEELGEAFVASVPKVGRNDPCSCGSGKKYKKCCGQGA